eukprot:4221047-Amphidinium_carterae.1
MAHENNLSMTIARAHLALFRQTCLVFVGGHGGGTVKYCVPSMWNSKRNEHGVKQLCTTANNATGVWQYRIGAAYLTDDDSYVRPQATAQAARMSGCHMHECGESVRCWAPAAFLTSQGFLKKPEVLCVAGYLGHGPHVQDFRAWCYFRDHELLNTPVSQAQQNSVL